ncbi:hypothetical protein ABGB16_19535 [Micromonospora sp. B11E3]|uniref:hypothetical protein n=1 Tax=Micromonospora sp. B11E3 TaxID=3153562 RepID=UPI00325E5E3B
MSTFDEYAALARRLAAHRRENDRDTASEAARRRTLHATLDQLGHRLAAQGHRLDQLGRAIGVPPPAASSAATAPGSPAAVVSGSPAATAPGSPAAAAPGSPAATASGSPAAAAPGPSAAVASGLPAAGGPSAVTASGPPATGVSGPVAPVGAAVPGPPAGPSGPGPTGGPASGGDPAAALAEAQRLAEEADRLLAHTEAVAHRPPLLPTWSPPARALVVYVGCALAGVVLMLAMVVASDLAVVGLGALYAATCAGLPVLSFLAGYLVLGRWGRPVLGSEAPPRFAPLGFVVCALLVPLAYCAYLLAFRLLP